MAEFQIDGTRARSALRTALAFVSAILIATPALAGVAGPERCLAGADFNGDGKADLTFEGVESTAAEGSARIVMMDGVIGGDSGFFSTGGGAWPYTAVGDTNDDGRTDLLGTGEGAGAAGYFRIELVSNPGTGVDSTGYLENGGGAWELFDLIGCTTISKGPPASTQDLNGDGQADLVTIGVEATAAQGFWRLQVMNASGVGSDNQGFLGNGGGAWELLDSADFNGDGRGDLLAEGVEATAAQGFLMVNIINSDGTGADATGYFEMGGTAWSFTKTGDLNGDGHDDILQTGNDGTSAQGYLRIQLTNSAGTGVDSSGFLGTGGGAWVLKSVEDMNDDDRDDLIWVGQAGTAAENTMRIQIIGTDGISVDATGYPWISGYTFLDVSDTDGNGRADLVLYTGSDVEIRMTESDGVSWGDTGTVTRGAGGAWEPISP
jgi:hypothetical protein